MIQTPVAWKTPGYFSVEMVEAPTHSTVSTDITVVSALPSVTRKGTSASVPAESRMVPVTVRMQSSPSRSHGKEP